MPDQDPLLSITTRLRRDVIQMITHSQSGHPGGALGAAELLAVLYFETLRHRPAEPDWPERDRFVLSNGHICSVLYACLARTGYFPPEELLTFRKINSRLQGHPSRVDLPGIETAAGPLGQGLSIANGMALALRLRGSDARVYCLVGDGEMQEGQFWEAALTSAHYHLDQVTLIISDNGLQIDGEVAQIKGLRPIADKMAAFGWAVKDLDGHSLSEIRDTLSWAHQTQGKPQALIASTVMGKGVSFMEGKAMWHGQAPSLQEAERALSEIGLSDFGSDLDYAATAARG